MELQIIVPSRITKLFEKIMLSLIIDYLKTGILLIYGKKAGCSECVLDFMQLHVLV